MDTVFVVGAGRVGTGLAVALARRGRTLVGVWSRHAEGATRAGALTAAPSTHGPFPAAIREASLVVLSVPDDAVAPVCAELVKQGRLGPGQTVIHVSGSLTLAPLAPAEAAGARVGSLHPLQAFSDPATAAEAFEGSVAVVDGSPEVRRELAALAGALGLLPGSLPEGADNRARYHAAAVAAAGHLVALMDLSLELAGGAGLDPELARHGLTTLARGALANLAHATPAEALTGPVARGDVSVVARHLEVLADLPTGSQVLYRALLGRSLDLVGQRGGLHEGHAAIRALLDATASADDQAGR